MTRVLTPEESQEQMQAEQAEARMVELAEASLTDPEDLEAVHEAVSAALSALQLDEDADPELVARFVKAGELLKADVVDSGPLNFMLVSSWRGGWSAGGPES